MKQAVLLLLILVAHAGAAARASERPLRIAILDFGDSLTGARVAEQLAQGLSQSPATENKFQIIDRDGARAAVAGIGYQGSLNLTLGEARDLGSAIGCDFFFTGVAATLRRSAADGPTFFESFAAIYLVSARTGKLILWERSAVKQAKPEEAERLLLERVSGAAALYRYQRDIHRASEDEAMARAQAVESPAPVIEEAPNETATAAGGLRLPRPYRRLTPPYPPTAAEAEVEATVDVLVDIDAKGEVGRIQIARWAGYDLDESVVDTVRQLHFAPAIRDGVAVPIRVLLRYNFRRPAKPDRGW